MPFWNDIFKKRSEDWFYYHLPRTQTPDDIEIKNLAPEKDYVNIFLKSMRIVNVRNGLSKFYGTVHSFSKLLHRSGKQAEFNLVTTPGKLEQLDAKNLDRVINLNKRLLGPAAYKGGDLELEVGLFSIKSADLAAPFISLLEEMSGLAGVSFIGAALPYVKPIQNGINLLTGGQAKTILEIGLSKTFDKISTGYYVVMRVPKDQIDVTDVKVDNDFRLTDKEGNPIKDYPYMVIQISSTPNKDDWSNIPEIQEAYSKLIDDVKKGDYNSAKESLLIFKRIVYLSNDLLLEDSKKIYGQVEATVGEFLDTTPVSKGINKDMPPLGSYDIYRNPN